MAWLGQTATDEAEDAAILRYRLHQAARDGWLTADEVREALGRPRKGPLGGGGHGGPGEPDTGGSPIETPAPPIDLVPPLVVPAEPGTLGCEHASVDTSGDTESRGDNRVVPPAARVSLSAFRWIRRWLG
jgi:hypothetical protein